jgi:hypothetical protein
MNDVHGARTARVLVRVATTFRGAGRALHISRSRLAWRDTLIVPKAIDPLAGHIA